MIDWEKQWEQHALNFIDGYLVLEIGNRILKLKPGPGFGDLSHPTTRLMLRQMAGKVEERYVFDIGCGSGVLALAAAALGASHVWAVDIDSDARDHTRLNIKNNHLTDIVEVVTALPKTDNPIALMNMIWVEQKQAWPNDVDEFITSGVLIEHLEEYVFWLSERNYEVRSIKKEGDWCALYFKKKEV